MHPLGSEPSSREASQHDEGSLNNKIILPSLVLLALGLDSTSAGLASNGPSHSGAGFKIEPPAHSSRCPSDSIRSLFVWKEGRQDKRISYCQNDSVDADGIIVISRLEILEDDLTQTEPKRLVYDSIGPGLASVRFYAPGAALIDVDGDGKKESFLPYYFAHDGADPTEIRFIARRKGVSYAIQATLPWLEVDADSYRMELDPALKTQPRNFRKATDSLLKVFVHKLCKDTNTGATSYIPVQLGGTRDDE